MSTRVEFSALQGLTLTSVQQVDDEEIRFIASDGSEYRMFHYNSCCESVTIESIVGDISDLIGNPILVAEEATSEGVNPPEVTVPDYQDSFTWTFYKLATIKGYVDIRWYGESNGYYSESVDFERTKPAAGSAS